MGGLGGKLHNQIVDQIRFGLNNTASECGLKNCMFVASEQWMLGMLRQVGSARKGRLIPDVLVRRGETVILIEVGNTDPDKWKDQDVAVIWVSFSRGVRVIQDLPGNGLVKKVTNALNHIFTKSTPA